MASYVGACLIESAVGDTPVSRGQIAWEILQYECQRTGQWRRPNLCLNCDDSEHKMILLLEYLSSCRCAVALKVPAGSA